MSFPKFIAPKWLYVFTTLEYKMNYKLNFSDLNMGKYCRIIMFSKLRGLSEYWMFFMENLS